MGKNRRYVESNPILFAQLSEQYYTQIHGVKNPIKDSDRGLKSILVIYWHDKYCKDRKVDLKLLIDDPNYSAWFEDAWKSIIDEGSFKTVKYHEGAEH